MWIVRLSWSSECYHTNWTKVYKKKKNAEIEYLKVIKEEYKRYCDDEVFDDDLDMMMDKINEMQEDDDDFELDLEKLKTED